jgi:hypothetical protein
LLKQQWKEKLGIMKNERIPETLLCKAVVVIIKSHCEDTEKETEGISSDVGERTETSANPPKNKIYVKV